MDTIGATPRNKLLGLLADALSSGKGLLNDNSGTVFPSGIGDFLLGKAPETLNDMSYGLSPLSGKGMATRVDPGLLDVAGIIPAGKMAAMGKGLLGAAPAMGLLGIAAKSKPAITMAERIARMEKAGMESGWYRGGPKPVMDQAGNTRRTGGFYTVNPEEAANYAKRFGKSGDVREYAIPTSGYLEGNKGYVPRLAHDLAKVLDSPEYGGQGAELAKWFRTWTDPEIGISGGEVWQALESRFGNDGAAAIIDKLGKFNGVAGVTAPGEVYVFKSAPVRDAKKAAFDPYRLGVDDIYGRATVPAMLGSGGLGLLGFGLLDANRMNSDRSAGKTP